MSDLIDDCSGEWKCCGVSTTLRTSEPIRLALWHGKKKIKLKTQPSVCSVSVGTVREHKPHSAFGICSQYFFPSFFWLHPYRFPMHLTLEGSNCLEAKAAPLSGNPLDTPIRQRGRTWNFNQKENIEFAEFKNVPLKQNTSNPLWYWKLLLLPPSWIKLFCLSLQLSSLGHYDPHYMACSGRGGDPPCLFSFPSLKEFPSFSFLFIFFVSSEQRQGVEVYEVSRFTLRYK